MSVQRLQHIRDHILAANKCAEMAASESPLTTHVLNIGMGIPGSQLGISLHFLNPSAATWNLITTGTTNDDGRCPGLISRETFKSGTYKLRFETGQYWEKMGQTSFYPYVEIVFTITEPSQKFHVPLLLSRFSYSTYRGS
ncbi:5-hydroxyisourate hydrolase [Aplochiton taeniatus]